jgi:hypothetical protein
LNQNHQDDEALSFTPIEQLIQQAKVEGEGFDFLFGNTQQKQPETIQSAFAGGFNNMANNNPNPPTPLG